MSEEAPKEGDGVRSPSATAVPGEDGASAPAGSRPHAPESRGSGHGLPIQLPFLEKIKRRHVGRVAILYLVVGYLVLEIFGVFFHLLAMPEWVGRAMVIVVALGFPVALLFAWAYEITPEGLKPSDEVDPKKSIAKQTGRRLDFAIMAMMAVALAYFVVDKFWLSKRVAPAKAVAAMTIKAAPAGAVFAPPPHSIAVLPFVNMSGDKDQEYFSEGLTEEVLNSLARLNELQVAARTSSFSFQGEHPDIATVAHKLNVGAVLEGSVRRSGHTVRITTQLVNGVTGFHLWSQTYDRDLGDVLKLQTEIANAVASALKVTLLGDVAAKIELGGTRNPTAFDAYLRASKAYQSIHDEATDIPPAIAAYSEAIRLDPNYALAFAGRSYAFATYTADTATGTRDGFEKAESDARRALALAPELAEAHWALAYVLVSGILDFARAQEEFERAMALAPGNAKVLRDSGSFAANMGHFEFAIVTLRRAVVLDPLDNHSLQALGGALYAVRRYQEAAATYAAAISLNPDYKPVYGQRGLAFIGLGDFERARTSCETHTGDVLSQECLAVVFDKLGRHADAEAELKTMQATLGDGFAYEYAKIYAQWGDHAKALDWLETAMRLRDSGLSGLKTTPLLDPVRKEPRFQAIERALKFPD